MLTPLQKLSLPFRKAVIAEREIGIRQSDGWHFLPKDEIAAIKAESVSKVIVRLYDGRRFQLSLFRLPVATYSKVMSALRVALHENRKRRGVWEGSEV